MLTKEDLQNISDLIDQRLEIHFYAKKQERRNEFIEFFGEAWDTILEPTFSRIEQKLLEHDRQLQRLLN